MTGGSDGCISDGSGDFAETAHEEDDIISMKEEVNSIDEGTPATTPKNLEVSEQLSDDEKPGCKKPKIEPSVPRDDLEDGEIETETEDEEPLLPPPPELPRSLRSLSPITGPIPLNRLQTTRPPRVDFPRFDALNGNTNNRRRKPEDFGICKFFLRDNCTWGDRCKYGHPVGKERGDWMRDLGISEVSPSNASRLSRRRSPSSSPRRERSTRDRRTSHNSGKKLDRQPSPVSSEGSRSPSPSKSFKRKRASPKSVAISSDEDEFSPKKRSRRHRHSSHDRSRSSSVESKRSASPPKRSSIGELLRKRRLEAEQKTPPTAEPISDDEVDDKQSTSSIEQSSPREESPELEAVTSDEDNNEQNDAVFHKRSASPPIASAQV